VIKPLMAVVLLISATLIAGAYFNFNPVMLIFVILGFGMYMVGRLGGPMLPKDSYISGVSGHGVYFRARDYVPPDTDSHSGGDLRDGVDPNDYQ
jgi:hypothetical protein